MRILILDDDSNALDFAMRAKHWGHTILWWDKPHKNGLPRRAGEGIIQKIEDFDSIKRKWMDWADLIWLPGNSNYCDMLEPYRKLGYPIYGCNVAAKGWESDRAAGQAVMKKAGLKIIPGREFHDYDSAIAYVKKEGRAFVSKPSGEANKAMTYVADSPADLVYMLGRWKENPKYVSDAKQYGFILQEKKVGCEMGAGGFFGPGGWSSVREESFEFKKLFAGDLGVNTGEQGTLIRFVDESKLAQEVLEPLTDTLKAIGYVGCINVNCMIDDEGTPWPLEFTCRDGWPAKHNHLALEEGDPAQWMLDLLNGRDTLEVKKDTPSISVVVTIPDYPFSTYTGKKVEGVPIYGADDMEHVHLCEVMLGEAPVQAGAQVVTMPCYLTSGDYVAVITGTGETITGARKSAYSALRKIRIPNSPGWRIDIGRGKLVEGLSKIQAHGYAEGLSY